MIVVCMGISRLNHHYMLRIVIMLSKTLLVVDMGYSASLLQEDTNGKSNLGRISPTYLCHQYDFPKKVTARFNRGGRYATAY